MNLNNEIFWETERISARRRVCLKRVYVNLPEYLLLSILQLDVSKISGGPKEQSW